MPKPMNKEMGGKPKMSGDQMKVLGRVMKYMLKNYKFSFIIVVACILIQAVTTLAGMMFMQSLVDDYITPMLKTSSHDFSPLAKALGGLAVVYVVGIAASYAYNRIMVNITLFQFDGLPDGPFGRGFYFPGFKGPERKSPLGHPLPQDIQDGSQFVFIFRRQLQIPICQFDGGVGAPEVIPLFDFLPGLVQCVVQFLHVDLGNNVERAVLGHK